MFISELNYVHLLAEQEAAMTRELELRRRVQERLEEEHGGAALAPIGLRRRVVELLRMPRRTRDTADPCPTCPSPA